MRLRSKYPLVRQYDQLDCGPAALLSVLRFYGGDTSLVHTRQLCRTDLQGTTMLDMLRAARALGFKAAGARGNYEELIRERMPCIAHVHLAEGLSHYLVLYKAQAGRLFIGDPGRGRYWLRREEFEKIWRERAVLLLEAEPPAELLRRDSGSWLRWIWGYLLRQQAWLQQILFTGLLYTAAGLLTALFVQLLIDRLIPAGDLPNLLFIAGALLLLLALRAGIGYLRDRLLVAANKRLSLEVTGDFLLHLFRLPKSFFDTRRTGDITSRIDDSLRIHRTCLLVMQSLLLDLLLVAGSLLFMFWFSSLLGALTLAALPFYTALLWRQARRLKGQQREVMKSHAGVEAAYIDSIQGIPEIMSFSAAPAFTRLNQSLFGLFQEHLERLGVMQAGVNLAVGLLGAAISVLLLALGAGQVIAGELLLGQFMAAYSLLNYILPAVTGLVGGFIEFQGAEVAAQRLMDLLLVESEEENQTPQNTGEARMEASDALQRADGPVTGRRLPSEKTERIHPAAQGNTAEHRSSAPLPTFPTFRIEGLSFAWPKSPPLLREVTMAIPSGRITGLWGASGAGKSTLVQLLQRKYPPLAGRICLDQIPIDRFELSSLRAHIGVVPQQIRIFNATLAENILLGRPAAALQGVAARLEELGLSSLPGRFNHGLLTLLGEEGRKLSGGETQLLALARALYGRPQLLVIDEGFSAIDIELEQTLAATIAAWARHHAVLLITHNLDSLRRTDYLYLLREGRIEEEGEPAELIDAGGLFQHLMLTKTLAAGLRVGRTA